MKARQTENRKKLLLDNESAKRYFNATTEAIREGRTTLKINGKIMALKAVKTIERKKN